jgi:hypothetical protein
MKITEYERTNPLFAALRKKGELASGGLDRVLIEWATMRRNHSSNAPVVLRLAIAQTRTKVRELDQRGEPAAEYYRRDLQDLKAALERLDLETLL